MTWLLRRQVYLNKLTGQLPPITANCPLCVRRQNTSDGFGSGLTVQPMRAGYGAHPGGLCAACVSVQLPPPFPSLPAECTTAEYIKGMAHYTIHARALWCNAQSFGIK